MGEFFDFEMDYLPWNWDGSMTPRLRKTPKERVVARYPKAYAAKCENQSCVYRGPASAAQRSQAKAATVLGIGDSARAAWLDAANKLPPRGKAAKQAPQPLAPELPGCNPSAP